MNVDGTEMEFAHQQPTRNPTLESIVGTGREFAEELKKGINYHQVFETVGLTPNKTFLLEGLPGTGKSYSVMALNNTLNKRYFHESKNYKKMLSEGQDKRMMVEPTPQVSFFYYDTGSYGTAYINRGSRIVQSFFDNLYYHASFNLPTVMVIDEADAILFQRGGNRGHREDTKVLETFMKNLQTSHDKPYVYTVLMTNLRESIDSAVLRAGRIDKKYTFDLPTDEERQQLFVKRIEEVNKKAGYSVIRNYNIDNLVELSVGFNGADVVSVVDKTLRNRVYEIIDEDKSKITTNFYVNGKRLEETIGVHREGFKEKDHKVGFKKK